MSEIMVLNGQLKLKIIQYQNEYLQKKGILSPDIETKIKMRRAVTARLKKEMIQVTKVHQEMVSNLFLPKNQWIE